MAIFKVGDTVRVVVTHESSPRGTVGVVTREPYGPSAGGNVPVKLKSGRTDTWLGDNIELVTSATVRSPKFILRYELDSEPFEVFSTEKELRMRIAELAAKPDLKRDSLIVYDVKRARKVELGVKITIK